MLLTASTTLLAGCSSGTPEASGPAPRPDGVTTIQPGLPGEPARTGAAEVPEVEANHADVAFMQMMLPHHAQAIEMAALAERHAVDPRVRRLAGRIKAAQGPEITFMAAWLERQGVEVPTAADDPGEFDHAAHGHGTMPGMLTDAQMQRLRDARGRAFDRLFLRHMIGHHAGAVEMAAVVAEEGSDLTVAEVAADVSVTQSTEIALMRQMLRRA